MEFMVLFQHGSVDTIVQRVQTWRVCGPLILLNEPVTVLLQAVLRDARYTEEWGLSWLK